MFKNNGLMVLSCLVLVSGLTAKTNASNANVAIALILDGHTVRCEEGGDTLGNQIGYSFGEARVRYNSASDKVMVALKTIYQRCELVNGKATVVTPINPFSPYTYKISYLNEKGERVDTKVTKQYNAIQFLASKPDGYESFGKSKIASTQSYNALDKSLTFVLELNVKDFLSTSEIADLNAGKDASLKAVLISTGQNKGDKEFLAGGSFLLSFDFTKARNSKENISNLKLQRTN